MAQPLYQSAAAILVVKKRPDEITGSPYRYQAMEDYVATQQALVTQPIIIIPALEKPVWYRITNTVLENLQKVGVPRDVLVKLDVKELKDQQVPRDLIKDVLAKYLSEEDRTRYQDQVLKLADKQFTRDLKTVASWQKSPRAAATTSWRASRRPRPSPATRGQAATTTFSRRPFEDRSRTTATWSWTPSWKVIGNFSKSPTRT